MSKEEEIARKTIPSPQNGSDLAYTWGETKQIMQAHTQQALQDLKKKLKERYNKTVDGRYKAEIQLAKVNAINSMITMIDEVIKG